MHGIFEQMLNRTLYRMDPLARIDQRAGIVQNLVQLGRIVALIGTRGVPKQVKDIRVLREILG